MGETGVTPLSRSHRRVDQMRVVGVTSTTISALGPNHGGPSGDGRVLIVAPVGKSSGNAVETQGNTPDGISNDRTIRRLQPHGHCLDWEKPGRSAQPVAASRRNPFDSSSARLENRACWRTSRCNKTHRTGSGNLPQIAI